MDAADVECLLCLSLLCDPVTITCGHSFCRNCLVSSLEKSHKRCPACRAPCALIAETAPVNVILRNVISKTFPEQYAAREREAAAERALWSDTIPLFSLSEPLFPGQPLTLHLFEPRYRVMVERVASTARRVFGYMTTYTPTPGAVGTLVQVSDIRSLATGSFVISAVGGARFTIHETWCEEPSGGLHVARIRRLEDGDEASVAAFANVASSTAARRDAALLRSPLHLVSAGIASCTALPGVAAVARSHELAASVWRNYLLCSLAACTLCDSIPPTARHAALTQYGPCPTPVTGGRPVNAGDVSALSFWIAAVLPLPHDLKMHLLTVTSLGERLWILLQLLWPRYGVSCLDLETAALYVQCNSGVEDVHAVLATADAARGGHAAARAALSNCSSRPFTASDTPADVPVPLPSIYTQHVCVDSTGSASSSSGGRGHGDSVASSVSTLTASRGGSVEDAAAMAAAGGVASAVAAGARRRTPPQLHGVRVGSMSVGSSGGVMMMMGDTAEGDAVEEREGSAADEVMM